MSRGAKMVAMAAMAAAQASAADLETAFTTLQNFEGAFTRTNDMFEVEITFPGQKGWIAFGVTESMAMPDSYVLMACNGCDFDGSGNQVQFAMFETNQKAGVHLKEPLNANVPAVSFTAGASTTLRFTASAIKGQSLADATYIIMAAGPVVDGMPKFHGPPAANTDVVASPFLGTTAPEVQTTAFEGLGNYEGSFERLSEDKFQVEISFPSLKSWIAFGVTESPDMANSHVLMACNGCDFDGSGNQIQFVFFETGTSWGVENMKPLDSQIVSAGFEYGASTKLHFTGTGINGRSLADASYIIMAAGPVADGKPKFHGPPATNTDVVASPLGSEPVPGAVGVQESFSTLTNYEGTFSRVGENVFEVEIVFPTAEKAWIAFGVTETLSMPGSFVLMACSGCDFDGSNDEVQFAFFETNGKSGVHEIEPLGDQVTAVSYSAAGGSTTLSFTASGIKGQSLLDATNIIMAAGPVVDGMPKFHGAPESNTDVVANPLPAQTSPCPTTTKSACKSSSADCKWAKPPNQNGKGCFLKTYLGTLDCSIDSNKRKCQKQGPGYCKWREGNESCKNKFANLVVT